MVLLSELIEIHPSPTPDSMFHFGVPPNDENKNWTVVETSSLIQLANTYWATPLEPIGDSSEKYHYKYVMAVLSVTSTPAAATFPEAARSTPLPNIDFITESSTRRSMTLNGMRMTTEYMTNNSQRILQLIDSRLAAHQSDVVHDVLVYLMNQVLDCRRNYEEELVLRSENIAAFLGLQVQGVLELLGSTPDAEQLTLALESGQAGVLRRAVPIASIVQNQMQLLAPAYQEQDRLEKKLSWLIAQVTERLWSTQ